MRNFTLNDNGRDDCLDVRDIIERIEHLAQLETPGPVDLDEDNGMDQDGLFAELRTLRTFLDELRGNGGDHQWAGAWFPVTLIRDSYFVEAMQELCEDIGDMPKGFPDYMVIDWTKTAENLRVDYTSAELDGVTYWFR